MNWTQWFSWQKRNLSADSAMKRAIILKHIFVKGLALPPINDFATIMSRWSPEEKSQFAKDMSQMFAPAVRDLKSAGLWRDVEEEERTFLLAGFDQISPQQRIDASWVAESIVCLIWALQIVPELPLYDQEAGQESVKKVPSTTIKDLIKQARLRPQHEIQRQRDVAELWHWRARTRRLQEEGRLHGEVAGGWTIEQIIETAAAKGAENGDLPKPIGSDFPVLGKPYRDASSEEFARLTSIAQERHKAFNWLCGFSPKGRWADTPTDT
jgi:hypothetical protein